MKLPVGNWTKENRYFSSLFLYVSALIAAVALAVSFILYSYFAHIEQRKIFEFSEESLSQISSAADSMLDNAKMAVAQILLDKDMFKVFYPTQADPLEMKTITDRINLIDAMPFLQSVYLYNGQQDLYYTSANGSQKSDYFADKGMVELMNGFEPSRNLKPITRVIKNPSGFADMDYVVYTFIYYETSGTGKGNAIILNISDSWMKKAIATLDKKGNGSIIIMDAHGVIVSSKYKDQVLTDLSGETYARDIVRDGQKAGHFIGRVDGEAALVTYAVSDPLQWIFVRSTPYNDALKELNAMRTTTLVVCALLLAAGFALSYVTSRRLAVPVTDMLKKLSAQHQTIRAQSVQAKQTFLQQFVAHSELPEPLLRQRFDEYGIRLDPERPVRVLLFKLDRFDEFTLKYNYKDRGLLRFGIMNIASELVSAAVPCEAVDLGGDHIALLAGDPDAAKLAPLIAAVQREVKAHLQLSVTAAVSGAAPLTACRTLYEEAREAAQYRVFAGWEAVLLAEEIAAQTRGGYRYPAHAEDQLTDALMLGKPGDALAQCRSILQTTEGHTYGDLNLTVFRLFFAIQMVVDTLEKASGYSFAIHFAERFARLAALERLVDIEREFMDMITQCHQKLGEKKSSRYEELMQRIGGMIEAQYMREDLSLDSIADALNMSPVYLGRLIKKHTSKSITDLIHETRMAKAADMLSGTEKLIADIAKETGFASNSYFGKVFKKYHGVTPNEYRQRARSGGEREQQS